MALLHLTQLYKGNHGTYPPTTVYTVPAGYRANVRSVVATNRGATDQYMVVGVTGLQVFAYQLTHFGGLAPSYEWRPWMVLLPGDQLQLGMGGGVTADWVVSGSLYTI